MCTTTDFESDNPQQPSTINLPTTLSRLLECRQKDMATYDELDELAVKVHEAHDSGNRELLSELLTHACDLEYGLMCDCDIFGDLAQQWRVDDTKGEAMYVIPESVLKRWDWITANAPAPAGYSWHLCTQNDLLTLESDHEPPESFTAYRIPNLKDPVHIQPRDRARTAELRACLRAAALCPVFSND